MSTSTIDLSKLAPPTFVEALSFEFILAEMFADLTGRDPSLADISEADPAYKVLEVAAYRELLLRQRINEEGKALLLAFAVDADLDHLGITYYNELRLLVTAADPHATPPIAAVYEDNDSYRRRLLLKDDGYSTAGSDNAYIFHALSASGQVKDASVFSPYPGTTIVYVLSRSGNGAPDAALLATVAAALNTDDVRPQSEEVLVYPAIIREWALDADILTYGGPDQSLVLEAAYKAVIAYIAQCQLLGYDITLDGLYAALRVAGVYKVILHSPLEHVVCDDSQATWCKAIDVRFAGTGK
ncbi:Baseplate assembly protein J [Collimonas arenae]|uniref:Baseplate assembly protein J n=1 Tax=Collimonas arenae TaxID=279058 RepID=A0A0A1FE10_9BURK|nr:baseplate J/gp47 family protein [Collimonas arenae]AIY42993.1 Baseplate assembly protein J [Collimonas arenae]